MSFTIEIRSDRESDNESTIIGRFSDCAWNSLWRELSVSRKHWEEWQASQANVPLLPDFPEISKLAYIDEKIRDSHRNSRIRAAQPRDIESW